MRKKTRENKILNKQENCRLIKACEQSTQPLVNKFLILMMVVFGLRIGEVAHLHKEWFDFVNKLLKIPRHEPCHCSYCSIQMKQMMRGEVFSLDDVQKVFWKPKTAASTRTIYFGFNQKLEQVITEFFKEYDRFPLTVLQAQHRIKHLGKMAGLKNLYSHQLRATAATTFANDGVNITALQHIMGWEDIMIAQHFMDRSGYTAQEELKRIYDHKKPLFRIKRRNQKSEGKNDQI